MHEGRHVILQLYAATIGFYLVTGAAAQFQGSVSCPQASGFTFLRLHGSLERNLGFVTRPANTSASSWISYLAFVCGGLDSCTGFSTLGWLKAEVGTFGTLGQWYALGSWDLKEDPTGMCAGFYIRADKPRDGCPQVSGYFLYENTDVSGGELVLRNRINAPILEVPTADIVAKYGEECDTYPNCIAVTSFGVLLGSLPTYKNLTYLPQTVSELYGQCVGLYIRIPQPMDNVGGFRSLVRANSSMELPVIDSSALRQLQPDFKIPSDWNSAVNYIELSFEGVYLPIGSYGTEVGTMELAQWSRNNRNDVKLWLGGPDGSRVARVTWYLTNVELEAGGVARFRIQTARCGWSALRYRIVLTYRMNALPQLPGPVKPPPDTPPVPGAPPPWPRSTLSPPQLPYSHLSSTTGNIPITLPPKDGDRNTTLISLTLPVGWSFTGARIVIEYTGAYVALPNASLGRSYGSGFGPMGQFVLIEARKVPPSLTPAMLRPPRALPPSMPRLPSPPSPPPSPPSPPGPPPSPPAPPRAPQPPTSPPAFERQGSPPTRPESPEPPGSPWPEDVPDSYPGWRRRLLQAPWASPLSLTAAQQIDSIIETSYTLPIESDRNGFDAAPRTSLYFIGLPLAAGSQVTLAVRTVNGGWNQLQASLLVEWQQPSSMTVTLPDMPSKPLLPLPPSPRPPSPRPPHPPLPPSSPTLPPHPPSTPPRPPFLPSPPRPPPWPPSIPQPPAAPVLPPWPPGITGRPDRAGPYLGPPPPVAPSLGASGSASGISKALVIGVPVAISGVGLCMFAAAMIFVVAARRRVMPRSLRLSELYNYHWRNKRSSSNSAAQLGGVHGGGGSNSSPCGDETAAEATTAERNGGADKTGGLAQNGGRKPPSLVCPVSPSSPPQPNRGSASGFSPQGNLLRGTWQGDLLPLTSFFPAAAPQVNASFAARTPQPGGAGALTGRATRGSESGSSPASLLPHARSRSSPSVPHDAPHGLHMPSPFEKNAIALADAPEGKDGSNQLATTVSCSEALHGENHTSGTYDKAGWGSSPAVLAKEEQRRRSWTPKQPEAKGTSYTDSNSTFARGQPDCCRQLPLQQPTKQHQQRQYQSCIDSEGAQRQATPKHPVMTRPNLSVNISYVSPTVITDISSASTDPRRAGMTSSVGSLPAAAMADNFTPALASSSLSLPANTDTEGARGALTAAGTNLDPVLISCLRSHGTRAGQQRARTSTRRSLNGTSSADGAGCLSGHDSGQQPDVESNDEDSPHVQDTASSGGRGDVIRSAAAANASQWPPASALPPPYPHSQPRDLQLPVQSPLRHHARTRRSSWCGYPPPSRLVHRGASVELGLELQPASRKGHPSVGLALPPIDLSSLEGVYRLIRAGAAALPIMPSAGGSSAAELPQRLSRTLSDSYMFTASGQAVAVAAVAAAAAAAVATTAARKRRSRGGIGRVSGRRSNELDPALLETPLKSRKQPVPYSSPPPQRRLVGAIPGFQSAAEAATAAAATNGGPYAHAFSAAAFAASTGACQMPQDYTLNRSRSCMLPGPESKSLKSLEDQMLPVLPSAHLLLPPHPHRGRRRRASAPLLPSFPSVPHNSPEDNDTRAEVVERSTPCVKHSMPKRISFDEKAPASRSMNLDQSRGGCEALLRSAALRLEAHGSATDVVVSVAPAASVPLNAVAVAGAKMPVNASVSYTRPGPPPPSNASPRSPSVLDDGGPFAAAAKFAEVYGSSSPTAALAPSHQLASPYPSIPAASSNASPAGGAPDRPQGPQSRSPPQPLAISTPSLPYRRPRYATELQTILSGALDDCSGGPPQPQAARRLDPSLKAASLPVPAVPGVALQHRQPSDNVLTTATASTLGPLEPLPNSSSIRSVRGSVSAGGAAPAATSATAVIARLAGTTSTTNPSSGSVSPQASGTCSGQSLPPAGIERSHEGNESLPTQWLPSFMARSQSYSARQATRMGMSTSLARNDSGVNPARSTASQLQRASGPFAIPAAAAVASGGIGNGSPSLIGSSSTSSMPGSRPGSGSLGFQLARRNQPMASMLSRAASFALRRLQASGQAQLSLQAVAPSPSGSEPLGNSPSQVGAAVSPAVSPVAAGMAHYTSATGSPLNASTALSSAVATVTASDQSGPDHNTSWATSTMHSMTDKSATTMPTYSGMGSLLVNTTLDMPYGQPSNSKAQPQPQQQLQQLQEQQQQALQQQQLGGEHPVSAVAGADGDQFKRTSPTETHPQVPQRQQQLQKQVTPKWQPPSLPLPQEDSPTHGGSNSTLNGPGRDFATASPIVRGTPRKAEAPNTHSIGKVLPEPALAVSQARTAADVSGSGPMSPFNDDTAAAAAWAAAAAVAMGLDGTPVKDSAESSSAEKPHQVLSPRDGVDSWSGSGGSRTPWARSRSNLQRSTGPSPRPMRSGQQLSQQQQPQARLQLPLRQKTADLDQQQQAAQQMHPQVVQQGQQQQAVQQPSVAQEQMLLVPARSVDMDLDPNEIHIFRDGLLGQGAYGAVYRGVYRQDMVAVKLINGSIVDGRALQRDMESFHAELSILSRLRHKNIVRVYGGCLRPPCIFLVMQLMQQSLDSVIHHGQRHLTLRRALQLARDVAAGLSYLHPTIVHRDLKPANILIDESGTAKISDFGLARYKYKAYLSTRTPDQGSVAYMAPECFNTDIGGLGPKTDIYSFGVLLWELLSGEYPWMGESNVQIIYKVAIKGERLPLPPADGSPFIATSLTGAPSYRSTASADSTQALIVPAAIRDLMNACFSHQPNERPDTHTAVCILDTIMMELDSGRLVVDQPVGGSQGDYGRDSPGSSDSPVSGSGGARDGVAGENSGVEGSVRMAGGGGSGGSDQGPAAAGSSLISSKDGSARRPSNNIHSSRVGDSGAVGDGGYASNGEGGRVVNQGAGQASATESGKVPGVAPCIPEPRGSSVAEGECLMAPGNQQQLATPFSNLDFLFD